MEQKLVNIAFLCRSSCERGGVFHVFVPGTFTGKSSDVVVAAA